MTQWRESARWMHWLRGGRSNDEIVRYFLDELEGGTPSPISAELALDIVRFLEDVAPCNENRWGAHDGIRCQRCNLLARINKELKSC